VGTQEDMHPLSASELLNTWERGLMQHPVQRALLLLEAAYPEQSASELGQLSLAERDARLMELRQMIFGSELDSLAACPACGTRLEASLSTQDLRSSLASPEPDDYTVSMAGYQVRFRLPNSLDLLAILPGGDPMSMRSTLLERCLVSVEGPLEPPESSTIEDALPAARSKAVPPAVMAAVAESLENLGDQTDIWLSLTCAACGHTWGASLDFPTFFWTEISAWARRLLVEVHTLAAAYGWREADILALSPGRRQFYLELIQA
jgi:hypothetical protein